MDAQEKTFTVIINDVLQATSKADDMPNRLAFFVQLDYAYDKVEFQILDFSFEKNRMHRIKRNDGIPK